MGQAAYLRIHPEDVADTFYKSIPGEIIRGSAKKLNELGTQRLIFNNKLIYFVTGPLYWPTFVVAVAAAIIASQAMISGAFAIIAQSQVEQADQLEVMASLRGRIEQLEYMEQEHEKMQTQLGAYKEMLDNASRNVHCLK